MQATGYWNKEVGLIIYLIRHEKTQPLSLIGDNYFLNETKSKNARKALPLHWTKILHTEQVKTIALKCSCSLLKFENHFFPLVCSTTIELNIRLTFIEYFSRSSILKVKNHCCESSIVF